MEDFWIVWHRTSKCPISEHLSEREAKEKAENLASDSPGETYYIAKTADCCWTPSPEPIWANHGNTPPITETKPSPTKTRRKRK